MTEFREIEDFQDSSIYLNKKIPKFIVIFILGISFFLILAIISLFCVEKAKYVEGSAILLDEKSPVVILSPEEGIVKEIKLNNNGELLKGEKFLYLDINTESVIREKNIIKQYMQKLNDLQVLSGNIKEHPYKYKIINQDVNMKQYELFKAKYKSITSEQGDNKQIEILKAEFLQVISEKMERLKDEIIDFERIDHNRKSAAESSISGKIELDKEIKVGNFLKKGQIIGHIYPNRKKIIKMNISDVDVHEINLGSKANIKLRIGDKIIKTEGKVNKIGYFPNVTNNEKNKDTVTYPVEIEVPKQCIEQFNNVAITTGQGYISTKKETIAEYLYNKIK